MNFSEQLKMKTYTFNQSRKIITVEKTKINIKALSYEKAVEKAKELTPFCEHAGAIDEEYNVVHVKFNRNIAIELSPEDNNGQATVETRYKNKLLFSNTPERETNDLRIKRLLGEGPLVGFYFCVGINSLFQQITTMTDEEVMNLFSGLINPQMVRENIEYINKQLFPKK